ncbi:MAG TPA: hypothetical protein VLC92_05525 [Rhodocyclaceae bacterium]|nr:hypothetical protein [Rhodocyclaceae bacterium]
MKNTLKSSLLALAASALLAACASPTVKMGNATDTSQLDLSKGRTIHGNAAGFQLLLLIPISVNGRMERAYQDLRNQAGDDVITNVKITESWGYAFVGTIYKTELEATVYPRLKPAAK